MMTKAFGKKLFGAGYEKLFSTVIINIVVFCGLKGAEIHLGVAPFITYLMTTLLTFNEMHQALSSDDNSQNMKNLIMMPFDNHKFILTYVLSLGLYTFISRTMMILAVVFAVSNSEIVIVVNAILCAVNATVLTAVIFSRKKYRIPAVIWFVFVFALNFIYGTTYYYSAVLFVSIVLAFMMLLQADAYDFYIGEGKKNQAVTSRKNAGVWVYLFRYIKTHKNYMTNTLCIWAVAAAYPAILKGTFGADSELLGYALPMGFAIVSMNTPLGVLLSCDRSLEQAIRLLPGQKRRFCLPYCGFIFTSFLIAETIYLMSCQLQLGNVSRELLLSAVLLAAQGAIFSVLLEWFFPIRGWKIENDLWHHPRKYIIPACILVLSGVVGLVPMAVYVFGAVLTAECLYLLYVIRE